MEKCPYCNGKGYIEAYCCNVRDMVEIDCPEYDGKKYIEDKENEKGVE